MSAYADTSFLVRIYSPHHDSAKALTWLRDARAPLPVTPLHRHELRTAIRLRVFRREVTPDQRRLALEEFESDLADNILIHAPIPWTDAFREAEKMGAAHAEILGVRSIDLLHVGIAAALRAEVFLTFDTRQGKLANVAGLRVLP